MLGIPKEKFCPKDRNGISHRLGIFDDDGQYKKFKTLGAKNIVMWIMIISYI